MSFSNLISEENTDVQAMANTLRDVVLSSDDRIKEKFFGDDSDKAYYVIGNDNNLFAAIQPQDSRCRLYLHDMEKVNHDEFNMTSGGDDQMPYIVFDSKEKIPRDKLQNLVTKVADVAVEDAK